MEQILLSLSARRKTVLHDSLQPDSAENRIQWNVQIESMHKANVWIHRQKILLRHHSGGQVSHLNFPYHISTQLQNTCNQIVTTF